MKIVHCCLSCFYIDGYGYQENELVRQNVADGHDVTVIASTETFGDNRKLTYLEPGEYIGTDGAKVFRLDYVKIPKFLARKLRINPGLMRLLESENPDVILFHGLCGWELLTVSKYKKLNPEVKLFADSHEDKHNSATSFISKNILHLGYYKPIIQSSLKHIDKVFCLSSEVKYFCSTMYRIPDEKMEMYHLGGHVLSDIEYDEIRTRTRRKHSISESDILFVQSGKFDHKKKLIESLTAFKKTSNASFRYFVIGAIPDEVEVMSLIRSDARIEFLGWKSTQELQSYLCAADVYVQPGSQSATMQNSVCARCAVILDDVKSHRFLLGDAGWLVREQRDLENVFNLIANDFNLVKLQSEKSLSIARQHLDYKMLAKRLEV